MAIPPYTEGYPPDGSSLGQTKATIRSNLDGSFLTLAVDHIDNNGNPGAKPAGFHKVIHMVPQAVDPAPMAGFGQLYSKTTTDFITDEALFWETGTGLISQLTMNFTPTIAANGTTFLPGGLILQWGKFNFASGSDSTTFILLGVKSFPNNCFAFLANQSANTTSANTLNIFNVTNLGFDYLNTSSAAKNFYWIALGN